MRIDEALMATYAAMGQELSDAGVALMVKDLQGFAAGDVLLALSRCRKELRRMSLADILQRIPGGHLGAEEAWSLVARSLNDEGPTVVWTREISAAFSVALGLRDDPVAARMAFKEAYTRLVTEALARGDKPKWSASLGWDVGGREGPLIEAVEKGRLSAPQIAGLLPYRDDPSPRVAVLLASAQRQLAA